MKFSIPVAACIALAYAKPSGEDKGEDHAPLKHHGAPNGASSWVAVDAAFFEANPQFTAFINTTNAAFDVDAEGVFSYPNGGGIGGKYIAHTCAGESDPGLYWGKIEGDDGVVIGDVGIFWELEDGTIVWSWANSDGFSGVNTAVEKDIESKCGFKKAVADAETSSTTEAAATAEPTSADVATTTEAAETTTA